MQVGDINLVDAIITCEVRIGALEKALDYILRNNYSLNKPSQKDLEDFHNQTFTDLQKKYPNMGIHKK